MTCDRAAQVHAYHDGELPSGARAAVEAHVAECPACRELLAELRTVSRLIAEAPLPEIPEASTAHYYDAWHVSRERGLLRISSWLTAAAAAVLVGSLVLWPHEKAPEVASVPATWEIRALMPPAEPQMDRPDELIEVAQWFAEDLSVDGMQ